MITHKEDRKIYDARCIRWLYSVLCCNCCCSQSEAVELQNELQHEYGYSLDQLTEVAGLGSAAAIVKACVELWVVHSCVWATGPDLVFFSHHRLSAACQFWSVTPVHFLLKIWRPFLIIIIAFIYFTRSLGCRPLIPACCYIAKKCRSSCGALFCGAPFRPNMLNMPKSAAGEIKHKHLNWRIVANVHAVVSYFTCEASVDKWNYIQLRLEKVAFIAAL